jgi:dihydromethanopterin reductase
MEKHMSVHLIAAVGLSGQIGYRGQVPWHGKTDFEEITRRDLAQFAKLTANGVLIMGHVTALSLPERFDAGGREIVIARHRDFERPGDLLTELEKAHSGREVWVCGGQKVYESFLPFIDWHHISIIPYDGPADRYMPPIIPVWRACK